MTVSSTSRFDDDPWLMINEWSSAGSMIPQDSLKEKDTNQETMKTTWQHKDWAHQKIHHQVLEGWVEIVKMCQDYVHLDGEKIRLKTPKSHPSHMNPSQIEESPLSKKGIIWPMFNHLIILSYRPTQRESLPTHPTTPATCYHNLYWQLILCSRT